MENFENTKVETPEDHPELFRDFAETPGDFKTEYPAYWSPYKSPKEKSEYQQRLPVEIQPFIRGYFQKHKDEISSRQHEGVGEYLVHLHEAWDRHLEVNRQIDCFLSYELKNIFGDWSPKEWYMAKRLLVAGMETDHSKTMYSGGIKKKLDSESELLADKYKDLDTDFKNELLSPSFVTFYEARDLEHKKYLASLLEGDPDPDFKNDLINRYHSGDVGLFELRLNQIKKPDQTVVDLRKEIKALEVSHEERFVKKTYFMMERKDIQDFEGLLKFDNVTEYEYTYSLKGLPDLFLREEILRRLVDVGEIDADVSVFSLTLNDFSIAIDNVIAKEKKHFTIKLRPYLQNYDTCGTACVMSILNRRGYPLDEESELHIWEKVGKPYNFPGGLADVMLEKGFNITFVQDKPELLDRNNPEFSKMGEGLVVAAKTYVALFEKALDKGLQFKIEDWNFKKVRSEIERGNPCLVYLNVSETVSHVVIARGIKNDRLEIVDPLGSIKYLTEDELNRRIVDPMGKRLIVVNKLPDDFFSKLDNGLAAVGY